MSEEKYRYEVVQNITPSPVILANLPTQGRDYAIQGWDVVDLTRLFKPDEVNRNESLQNAIEKIKWLKVITSVDDVMVPDRDKRPLAVRMRLGDKVEAQPTMYTQLLRLHEEKEEMANLLELTKAGTASEQDRKRLEELQTKFRTDEVQAMMNMAPEVANPITAAARIFEDRSKSEVPKPEAPKPEAQKPEEQKPKEQKPEEKPETPGDEEKEGSEQPPKPAKTKGGKKPRQ